MMIGEVNLVSMKFNMDTARILEQTPLAIPEQTLVNKGDTTQTMQFAFTEVEGWTESLSSTVGFEYGITYHAEVGFEGFGKASFQVSFKLSASQTIQKSMHHATTNCHNYVAKAIVQQAEMNVGYEMCLGVHKRT